MGVFVTTTIGDAPALVGDQFAVNLKPTPEGDGDLEAEIDNGDKWTSDTTGTVNLPDDGNGLDITLTAIAPGSGGGVEVTPTGQSTTHIDGPVYNLSSISFDPSSAFVGDDVTVNYDYDDDGQGLTVAVKLTNGTTSFDVPSSGSTVSLAGATAGDYYLQLVFGDYGDYSRDFTGTTLTVTSAPTDRISFRRPAPIAGMMMGLGTRDSIRTVDPGGGGEFIFIDGTIKNLGASGGYCDAINTVGAGLLVLVVAYFTGDGISILDPLSNSWTLAVLEGNVAIYYSIPTTVNASHAIGTTATYSSLAVLAFAGGAGSPLDDTNGAFTDYATSSQPGAVDPTADGDLIVTAISTSIGAESIGSGFSTPLLSGGGAGYRLGVSCLIQDPAASINPTWSFLTGQSNDVIAAFKAA